MAPLPSQVMPEGVAPRDGGLPTLDPGREPGAALVGRSVPAPEEREGHRG